MSLIGKSKCNLLAQKKILLQKLGGFIISK